MERARFNSLSISSKCFVSSSSLDSNRMSRKYAAFLMTDRGSRRDSSLSLRSGSGLSVSIDRSLLMRDALPSRRTRVLTDHVVGRDKGDRRGL